MNGNDNHPASRPAPRRRRDSPAAAGVAPGVLALAFAIAAPCPAWAQALPVEVQVGTRDIKDFEFDWGRDGEHCPSCNYGAGNSRFSYVDADDNVWVGYLNPDNGYFFPTDDKGVLVDSNAVTAEKIGNGPEWMNSALGSQLVYTRWVDRKPHTVVNLQLGMARQGGTGWVAGPIPDSVGRVLPVGSDNPGQPNPVIHYQTFPLRSDPTELYWRGVYPGAVEVEIPVASSDQAGLTRRWVPKTKDIIITAPTDAILPGNQSAAAWRQVFLFHADTNAIEQLTFDGVNKYWASAWHAPEFDNELVFVAMVGGDHLNIYRNLPVAGGGYAWQVVKTITTPDATPYVSSPEAFVYNGASWVFFSLTSDPNGRNFTRPSLIAMSGIEPEVDNLRLLTSADDPPRARRDPEYFITANGPYLYYNRYLLETDTRPPISEGVFRVDTQLGPPAATVARGAAPPR